MASTVQPIVDMEALTKHAETILEEERAGMSKVTEPMFVHAKRVVLLELAGKVIKDLNEAIQKNDSPNIVSLLFIYDWVRKADEELVAPPTLPTS